MKKLGRKQPRNLDVKNKIFIFYDLKLCSKLLISNKILRFSYILHRVIFLMVAHCECGICGHFDENECVKNECKCCSNFHLRSGPKIQKNKI